MSTMKNGRNSGNMVNGDFLVGENGVGVKGITNIEVMEKREEQEAHHDELEFNNDGGFEKDGDILNKEGKNDFVR